MFRRDVGVVPSTLGSCGPRRRSMPPPRTDTRKEMWRTLSGTISCGRRSGRGNNLHNCNQGRERCLASRFSCPSIGLFTTNQGSLPARRCVGCTWSKPAFHKWYRASSLRCPQYSHIVMLSPLLWTGHSGADSPKGGHLHRQWSCSGRLWPLPVRLTMGVPLGGLGMRLAIHPPAQQTGVFLQGPSSSTTLNCWI